MRDELLSQAVAHHKAGRFPVAVALYERVLAQHPDDADALQLCALSRLRLGETARALALFDRALAVDPGHVAAAVNRARAWLGAGRAADAAKALAAVVKAHPDRVEAWRLLAEARLESNDARGAVKAQSEVLSRTGTKRAAVLAAVQIGGWLRERGRATEAIEVYAAVKETDADVLLGLGNAKRAIGDDRSAIDAFRKAASARPGFVEANHNLGLALIATGSVPAGIAKLAEAARASTETWPWISLTDAFAAHGVPEGLEGSIAEAFTKDGVDHQALERVTREAIERTAAWERHPLFVPLLEHAIVQDPRWEAFLVDLRRRLASEPDERLILAMARQAWYTEYAWPLPPGAEPIGPMYGPPGPDGDAAELEEIRRAEAMPVLAMTTDSTSAAVRAMYEENPYPRLASQHRKPAEPFPQVIRSLFPHLTGPLPGGDGPFRVLIAGCGTGQQALAAATRYSRAEVTAIDLSRRSLGRASRTADAWGLTNVKFAQADILALGCVSERFELVESGGVLHHLADPYAGWKVLRGLLAPCGFMKLALYSERGRPAVIAARAFVEATGFSTTPDGLRAARAAFLALPEDHPARPIVYSPDFYSLTGLRDLVFHVHEIRYTMPRLASEIASLGLAFVGFQHARPEPRAWYRERFPDDVAQADLARWEQVEDAHPHAFAGMYQFWVRG